MKRNQLLNTLVSAAAARRLGSLAPAGILGLGRRRRSQPSLAWFAAGAAVAGAAAVLMTPTRRKSFLDLLQRSGGGIGKQLGKFVGSRVGAHPVETTRLIQNTRDLVGSTSR